MECVTSVRRIRSASQEELQSRGPSPIPYGLFYKLKKRETLRKITETGVSQFLKDSIYLFIFRERGRKGERDGNINVW